MEAHWQCNSIPVSQILEPLSEGHWAIKVVEWHTLIAFTASFFCFQFVVSLLLLAAGWLAKSNRLNVHCLFYSAEVF